MVVKYSNDFVMSNTLFEHQKYSLYFIVIRSQILEKRLWGHGLMGGSLPVLTLCLPIIKMVGILSVCVSFEFERNYIFVFINISLNLPISNSL